MEDQKDSERQHRKETGTGVKVAPGTRAPDESLQAFLHAQAPVAGVPEHFPNLGLERHERSQQSLWLLTVEAGEGV